MVISSLFDFYSAVGEYYAAGLFEHQNGSYLQRHADALSRVLELGKLPEYHGTQLYPVGLADLYSPGGDEVYRYFYAYSTLTRSYPEGAVEYLCRKGKAVGIEVTPYLRRALGVAHEDPAIYHHYRGWTHSVIHFQRILSEGLGSYEKRLVEKEPANPSFYGPLLQVLHAIQNYIRRCEAYLQGQNVPRLVEAFHQMIEGTPRNLYEAFVFYNFFYYVDGNDDGGRMDAVLEPYRKDETDEEISRLFHECWIGFFENASWHVTFDSHLKLLAPALQAQRGMNRPNSSVLIDDETPQEIWDTIFDSWDSGNTNPALYFRPNYRKGLDTVWNVRPEDFDYIAYGGCTELMIQGRSNVGSTDGRLLVLHALSQTALKAESFEAFYARLMENIRERARQCVRQCELGHEVAATYQPNLIRTLFTDDCIDRGMEFNACGPRYNSGLIGVVGLTNLVNAVYNIRLAYEGTFSLDELELALKEDFQGHEALLQRLRTTPKFGNDIEDVDSLAQRIIHDVFSYVHSLSQPHRTYIPFINLFTTYANEGSFIPATADGRLAGTPVGDSFGAVQGTDTCGPTALLNSVTKPNQQEALGTPVFNLRLSKAMISTPERRQLTKSLILAYFHRGGLQIQVSILDTEAMKQAVIHPENYKSLMVRMGGYSEYFVHLSPALQQEVIRRSEHTV